MTPSASIVSDGSYGIAKGIVYSYPVRCDYGRFQIVRGLKISDFARKKMTATEQELLTEMKTVADLLPKETEASHQNLSVGLRSGQYLRTDRVC